MRAKILVLFLITTKLIFSQGGALSFTTLQQSHQLLGAGQIGTAIPNDDVLGFYLNPAILGYSARNNHASVSFMPDKTEWFFSPEYKFNNYGLNLGYNLKNTNLGLPISVGLGFLHNKFDFGESFISNSENYDLFNSFSLGVGLDYYVKFNLGLSIKTYESKISGQPSAEEVGTYRADGSMLDYGALIIFPLSDLFMKNCSIKFDESTKLIPKTNLSIGYALSNFGDEIYYVDPFQTDLLARTERLGYSLEFGFDLSLNKTAINIINYSFTAEAQDLLIRLTENFQSEYQGILSDISIGDHIIGLKGDDNVIVHKGHIFKFFDTLILTSGSFHGRGYSSTRKTDGIGFSTKGLFKLLSRLTENSSIKYITKHLIIEYYDSNVQFWKNEKTNFDGLSIHFRGFEI